MNDPTCLHATLPALQRLALAYCPQRARQATLGLLALDTRLARMARRAGEPILSQIRFAWWRETLDREPESWPAGEPLLAALSCWKGQGRVLVELVDAWDELASPSPLGQHTLTRLAEARGACFAALCMVLGIADASALAASRAKAWAIADIAERLSVPEEREMAGLLLRDQDWKVGGLPRLLRPLAVLHGLAARGYRRGTGACIDGTMAMLAAVRLGLLGR